MVVVVGTIMDVFGMLDSNNPDKHFHVHDKKY